MANTKPGIQPDADGKRNPAASARPRPAAGAAPRRARMVDGETRRRQALSVLEQFRLIFRSAKKHFQAVRERTGVGGAQLWALAEVQRRPGVRVTELARAMAVHQSTASNLVERLAKDGLLRRERSREDQRVVLLSLTAAGRATVARAPRPLEGVLPNALNAMAATDLLELQACLEKLAHRLKVRDRTGRRVPLSEM